MSEKQQHSSSSIDDSTASNLKEPVLVETAQDTSGDLDDENNREYPTGWRLTSISIGLCFAVFLVALDSSIIATAIPKITDQFHSLNDVGWYGSAYLLTTSAFTLLYGRLYTLFPLKPVFLAAIGLFELGSLICGVAPSSIALIVGRAIAGLGSAGIFSGALIIIANATPIQKRPIYTGIMSAMYGVASVAGPLLGGAFTDKVSWRWCFYINLPIGAVTVVIIAILFKSPPSATTRVSRDWIGMLKQLDLIGMVFFMPSIVCLLLALQFGGTQYAWSDGRIITYFVVFGVCILIFIGVQFYNPDTATINPKLMANRSVWSGAWYAFCMGASFYTLLYYLPIWFQAVKGVSAFKSGIMNIPLVLATVIGAIGSGILVTIVGYYVPFMILGTVLMSIGEGLLTTFQPNTGHAKWIGYQVLCGLGVGMGMQQPLIAVQVVLDRVHIPAATALLVFMQTLGASLFVSIAQNKFENELISGIKSLASSVNPQDIIQAGATNLQNVVSGESLIKVIQAYNNALSDSFVIALAMSCLTIFGALTIEWKSVKGKQIG